MIQWTLMTFMIIMNFIFLFMKHPLAMGLTILLQTTLITMFSGMLTKTFWFSYILFLVFMGGMLVLFMYVTSLASNEMFSLSMKLTLMSILLLILMMILMMINQPLIQKIQSMQSYLTTEINSYLMENSLLLNKLYNFPTNLLMIMLMIYLLITLIVVVKITKLLKGPLRPSFN
uniref:NADH dehydrogenase subunit 6 n=1 Tax=Lophosia angusticauda TaxID=2906572 RepID=UPI0023D7FB1D|nr:NADH dehydrogenase subunit 6 [Lophosia angusticauda]WDE75735.1 NADH dehydrogenase subunit 6 [Lophosia angusticauda]